MNYKFNIKQGIYMNFLKIVACSALYLSAGMSQAQNLIANGSFEQGSLVANFEPNLMLLGPGATNISDWTIVGAAGSTIAWVGKDNLAFPAKYGDRFLDLTGIVINPVGQGVAQTISTVPGFQYTLSFDIGNSTLPDYGAISSLTAIAGNTTQLFTHAGNDGTNSWHHYSMDFTATDAQTNISLLSAAGRNYIGLDNVSVMASVPEPETYAMLLAGLALVGFTRLRGKARA